MSKAKERREWLRNERELWVLNDHGLYLDWCRFARQRGVNPDGGCVRYEPTLRAYIRTHWREIDAVRKS